MNLWTRVTSSHPDGTRKQRLIAYRQPFTRWAIARLFHHVICRRIPSGWRLSYRADLRCYALAHKGRQVAAELPAPPDLVNGEVW